LKSFVGGIVMFKTLARPQFAAVQSRLFPVYFTIQTAVPVILAATYPRNEGGSLGLSGVLDPANRWSVLSPIAAIFVSALLNFVVLLPATIKVMGKRRDQGKVALLQMGFFFFSFSFVLSQPPAQLLI